MATTTIPWDDGSGDNIYLNYSASQGDQTVLVSSDANNGPTRSKNIRFVSSVGDISRTLTILQESNMDLVSITWNDVCITYDDTAIGYQDTGSGGRLPAGYTEYDYLQSSGNTELATTVFGSATWYITAQCSSPSSGSQIVIGYSASGGCWAGQVSSKWSLGGGANTTIASSTKSELVIHIGSPTTYLTVGGETVSRNMGSSLNNALLFRTSSYSFIGKIFGDVVAVQNGVESFHGIPCTNPNNEAGYYDTVSKSFIKPHLGTLTAGNE